jgi:hypothetical protein
MAYGEDDVLNILEVSSLRAGDHGSGATAAMVAEVFRAAEQKKRMKGRGDWRGSG